MHFATRTCTVAARAGEVVLAALLIASTVFAPVGVAAYLLGPWV